MNTKSFLIGKQLILLLPFLSDYIMPFDEYRRKRIPSETFIFNWLESILTNGLRKRLYTDCLDISGSVWHQPRHAYQCLNLTRLFRNMDIFFLFLVKVQIKMQSVVNCTRYKCRNETIETFASASKLEYNCYSSKIFQALLQDNCPSQKIFNL